MGRMTWGLAPLPSFLLNYYYPHHRPYQLVSGWSFHQLARFTYDRRYKIHLDQKHPFLNVQALEENDMVFICFKPRYFAEIIDKFAGAKAVLKGKKFIIIAANTDYSFTEEHYKALKPFVHHIYAINNLCHGQCDNMVSSIPIGFLDNWPFNFSNRIMVDAHKELVASTPDPVKKYWVFMKFTINNNRTSRIPCYEVFKNLPFVHTGNASGNENINQMSFYSSLFQSRYVLSPLGKCDPR